MSFKVPPGGFQHDDIGRSCKDPGEAKMSKLDAAVSGFNQKAARHATDSNILFSTIDV
jgi:hypothetical protein